jgi:hypothetical protein
MSLAFAITSAISLIIVLLRRDRRDRLVRTRRAAEIARQMDLPKSPVIENASEVLVYVEHDGSVRELTDAEKEVVDTPFHPADRDRLYIKLRYDEKDMRGAMQGYLRRTDVPDGININPPPIIPQPLDGGRRFW